MTSKKVIMVCETCGCADVTADACASWDFAAQEWSIVTVYDNSDCQKCGGETNVVEHEADPARLFNCCTDHRMPDWSLFDWIEVNGCVNLRDGDGKETGDVDSETDDTKADFWTVHGHLVGGGLEAITDCKTRAEADEIAAELATLAGLKVEA